MDRTNGAGHIGHLFVAEDAATNRPPTEFTPDWFNDVQEELCGLVEGEGIALAAGTRTQVAEAIKRIFQKSAPISANASGTVDAITANFTPAITALTANMLLIVRASGANTLTTPTFTPASATIPPKTVVKGHNQPLEDGDISGAGYRAEFQYDLVLDKWVLLNPAKGVGLPSKLAIQQAAYDSATAAGTADAITAAYTPAITAPTDGMELSFYAGAANTSPTPTFTPNSGVVAVATIVKGNNLALVAGDILPGWNKVKYSTALTKWVLMNPATGVAIAAQTPVSPVRQTVQSGPVDANGYSSFGGATGGTTVTAAGTLIATAANGFGSNGSVDRIGSILNPSWTGLNTNGVMYLYLDIAGNGTCTPGSTTLLPNYQFGGAYSVTNNQHTFNTQEMVMKVGNGAAATQVYRVFVGEVTVAGGVVTAITWYALQGRYRSQWTSCSVGLVTNSNDNLGVQQKNVKFFAKCVTAEFGYAVGDILQDHLNHNISSAYGVVPVADSRNTTKTIISGSFFAAVPDKSTAGVSALTPANWNQSIYVERGW